MLSFLPYILPPRAFLCFEMSTEDTLICLSSEGQMEEALAGFVEEPGWYPGGDEELPGTLTL